MRSPRYVHNLGGVQLIAAASKVPGLSLFDAFVAFIRALITGEPQQIRNKPMFVFGDGTLIPLVSGGDGTDDVLDAEITAQLEDLTNVEDLDGLLSALRDAAAEVSGDDTDDAIAALDVIAAHVDSVKAEQTKREEAAVERETKRAEALARINEAEDVEEEPEASAEEEKTEEPPAAEEVVEEEVVEEKVEEKEPVTASARPTAAQLNAKKPLHAKPRKPERPATAIVAAGDVRGYSAGQEFKTIQDVGRAFERKGRSLLNTGQAGHALVASIDITDQFPEDRRLTGADSDIEKIEKVISPEAIVAAGGVCAPVEARYDVLNISTDQRPIRDALARFNASRGGLRFVPPPTLAHASVTGATTHWTHANDQTPSSPATKNIATITCGDETTVYVDAIVARVLIGNFARRFSPERFSSIWAKVMAYHARVAEDALWDKMVTASTAVAAGQTLGTARDVLAILDRAVAGFRSRNRMPAEGPLEFYAPAHLRDNMRADLTRQHAGDNTYAVANAELDSFFSKRNIKPVWSLDESVFGAEEVPVLDPWPSTYETILTHPGAFLMLDGGSLDLGTEIRDTDTNELNNVEAFTETFEGLAFVGEQSLAITFDVCPSGEAAALVDTTGAICSGS